MLERPQLAGKEVVRQPSTTRTVTVHLKGPLVIGLPKHIMDKANQVAAAHGTKRKWTMGFDNRIFTVNTDDAGVAALRENPLVAEVRESPKAKIANTPLFAPPYGPTIPVYDPTVVNTDWGVTRMRANYAWGKGIYGQGVKLCVLDTGIQTKHQAFWNNGITPFKGGRNFVEGTYDPEDDMDHGTWCCGIIASQHNGIEGSYRGIAPEVDLYVCKVLDAEGNGYYADVASAIDWAREKGMHIVSMSLGGAVTDSTLSAACVAAAAAGVLLIAAAGNDGPTDDSVNYPARYPSCLAVAALDYFESVADWSSRGPEVSVAAPGVNVVGPWAGFVFWNASVYGSKWLYVSESGTSGACPHVAAAAALIKSWYPAATAAQIRTYLQNNARDL